MSVIVFMHLYSIFQKKTYSEDTKTVAHKIIVNKKKFEEHGITINETDRLSLIHI